MQHEQSVHEKTYINTYTTGFKITYVKVGDEVYYTAGDWEEEAA